jgi:hypothetical protein
LRRADGNDLRVAPKILLEEWMHFHQLQRNTGVEAVGLVEQWPKYLSIVTQKNVPIEHLAKFLKSVKLFKQSLHQNEISLDLEGGREFE